MGKVYSPSSSANWTRCPIKNLLEHQWEPKVIMRPALARMLGLAIGVGVSTHYTNRKYQQGIDPIQAAVGSAKAQLQDAATRGLVIHPDFAGDGVGLPIRVEGGIKKYIEKDPIPASWEIVDIERDLGEEYGHARIDLGIRLPHGELTVWDLKVKRTLEAKYHQRTLDEYRHSWQMKHYRWAYGEVMGERVMQAGIILVVLEPTFRVLLDQTTLDDEVVGTWLKRARRVWEDMEAEEKGERTPWEAADHWDRYGQCPWYRACMEHRLVPALMEMDYVRRTK